MGYINHFTQMMIAIDQANVHVEYEEKRTILNQ